MNPMSHELASSFVQMANLVQQANLVLAMIQLF
jgi:hypothetical protein